MANGNTNGNAKVLFDVDSTLLVGSTLLIIGSTLHVVQGGRKFYRSGGHFFCLSIGPGFSVCCWVSKGVKDAARHASG